MSNEPLFDPRLSALRAIAPEFERTPAAVEQLRSKGAKPPPIGRESFRSILSRTVPRLEDALSFEQLVALADVFTVICWEFPDIEWRAGLVAGRDPPSLRLCDPVPAEPCLTVTMDSTVLAAAAAGSTSLGSAFLGGKLRVQGLNPLFLARFVKLIDPLLRSFRAASEAQHARSA